MIELSTFYICITARGFAHLRSDDGDVNLHFPCCPQTSPFWVGHHTGGVPFLWAVPFWFWFLGCVLNSRIERSEVRLGNVELESFESIYFNVITQFDHFLQLPSEISAKWVFYHPELQTPSGKTVSSYVMQRNQWSHLGLWRRPRPLASSDVECLEMRNEPSTQRAPGFLLTVVASRLPWLDTHMILRSGYRQLSLLSLLPLFAYSGGSLRWKTETF